MIQVPLLTLVTFTPLLGAVFILLIQGNEAKVALNARLVGMFISLVTLVMAVLLWVQFNPHIDGYQFQESFEWLPGLNMRYQMGVDSISLPFILLNSFLIPVCLLASLQSITHKVREYVIAFLVLETFVNGLFCALDMVLFYLFFEGVLIPMFFIIGIWGGPQRLAAAFKFFLYTFLGSVLMLVAILVMYTQVGTTDIMQLTDFQFDPALQKALWLAFFASFAVKIPMWPLHTWLPEAHVEAPTAGSVILAGILLKMGGYGFLRFSLPFFPEASVYFAPMVCILSLIAIVYASLVALAQKDMKKLIAYSSIAHMGFVTLGIFSFTPEGLQGSVVQMISHGVVSAALFLCVGVVYHRLHTREIQAFGGLVTPMPLYATLFMVFILASIGLPGTSGFIGEFLVLMGTYQVSALSAVVAGSGLILGAGYALWLYKRVIFGPLQNKELGALKDLLWTEKTVLVPLGVLVFFIGLCPSPLLNPLKASTQKILLHFKQKAAGPQTDPLLKESHTERHQEPHQERHQQ